MPAGRSLADLLKQADLHAAELDLQVHLDEVLIEPRDWQHTIVGPGQLVVVRVVPGKGGGFLRVVAMLAVVAASFAAPWGANLYLATQGLELTALGTGILAAGVGLGGALLVNALIPPDVPRLHSGHDMSNPAYAITGIRNRANPYGPIPEGFGRRKIYPQLAAKPYSENYGSESWLRMLFVAGKGEYQLSDYKITETALSTYSDYEISDGDKDAVADLYPNTVHEDALSIQLTQAAGWQQQTSQTNTTELSVDITLPNGLWWLSDNGHLKGYSIDFEVQYSVAGAGIWNHFPGSPMSVKGYYNHRQSFGFRQANLSTGQYDVRVRKTSADEPGTGYVQFMDDCYWTALRSINYAPPFAKAGVHLIALKIKATGQLNGIIDQFNLTAERKLPIWNGSSWSAPTVTRNPAWAYCEVLRGDSNARAVADSEIAAADFLEWANACTSDGFNFDGWFEEKTTVGEMLNRIAAAGRAARGWVDGQHTIVRDKVQTAALQHFSPRNSWGYRGRIISRELPHALKCRLQDESQNYQQVEIIVCDDGYYSTTPAATTWQASTVYALGDYVTPTTPNGYYYRCITAGTSDSTEPTWTTSPRDIIDDNTVQWMCEDAATEFETWDFPYVVDPDQVWMLARYHLAVGRLRPEVHEKLIGWENLRVTRGDRVRVTNDVIAVGLGQARIKEISYSGADVDGVTMDDIIPMEAGKSYGAQIRRKDGTMVAATIVTNAGEQKTITFSPVIPAADAPNVGDMIFFGEAGKISLECIVRGIEPGPDLTARVTMIDYAPEVLDADSGTIPNYDPQITIGPEINRVPPTPNIEAVHLIQWPIVRASSKIEEIYAVVDFTVAIGSEIEPEIFHAQYRIYDDQTPAHYSDWTELPDLPKQARHFQLSVENAMNYDFRVRSVSRYGATSAWDTYSDYTVNYTPSQPDDITGLQLIQGGSTFAGSAAEITWTPSNDAWRVDRYKIGVYKTAGDVLLRTEYTDVDHAFYSYSLEKNIEDNSGTPVDGLTFRVWAVSPFDQVSQNAASLAVTAAAPATPTGLQLIQGGTQFTGSAAEITWSQAADPWAVKKYKLEVYKTSPLTLRRAEYLDVKHLYYSYDFSKSLEDGAGTPATALTFKLFAVSAFDKVSATSADLAVTNPAPDMSAVTPTVTGRYGFLEIDWSALSEPDIDYYEVLCDGSNPPTTSIGKFKHPAIRTEAHGLDYGTTYYVKIVPYDIFGQAGTASQVASGTTLEIPDINIDVELSASITKTDSDSNPPATLNKLTDRNFTGDGVSYTVSGTDKYIQYQYELENYFDRLGVWTDNANGRVYVAYSDDGSTWNYLKAEADHTLDSDGKLLPASSQSDARTNYWQLAAGKNVAVLPDNLTARYVRLYLTGSYTTTIYELIASRIIISELAAIEHLSSISADVGTIKAGVLQSVNWGTSQGFYLDLENERLRMGGSSAPKVDFNAATGSYSFEGTITVTGGNAVKYDSGLKQAGGAAVNADDITADGTTYKRYSGTEKSKLSGIESGADVTGSHTAAAISGQGSLATQNSADWSSQVAGAGKPADNATVGATFGTDISGGGSGTNQVGNDGYITIISGGIITTGTLNASLCNVTNINAANISTGYLSADRIDTESLNLSKLTGASGSLTISSTGSITISTTDGLIIGGSGNILLNAGGDILLTSHDSNPGKITFKDTGTGTTHITFARDETYDRLYIYPENANSASLMIGYDVGAGLSRFGSSYYEVAGMLRLQSYYSSSYNSKIELYSDGTESTIEIRCVTNNAWMKFWDDGWITCGADNYFQINTKLWVVNSPGIQCDGTLDLNAGFDQDGGIFSWAHNPGHVTWGVRLDNTHSSGNAYTLHIDHSAHENAADKFWQCESSAEIEAYMAGDGDLYSRGSWKALSDQRAKENIVPMRAVLKDFLNLEVKQYTLGSSELRTGIMAQDLAVSFPEFVSYDEEQEAYFNSYEGLIHLVFKAVQELAAEVRYNQTN